MSNTTLQILVDRATQLLGEVVSVSSFDMVRPLLLRVFSVI